MKKCLIVLGMHRSGTSAIAGLLSKLGISLGSSLLAANEYNEKGYFENSYIVSANDDIIQTLGSSWDDLFLLDDEWWQRPQLTPHKDAVKKIIHQEFSANELFCIKDPRISILLPFWISILKELNIEPFFIIPLRHPLEVAESLKTRDGFSVEKGLLLWMNNMLSIEYFSRSYRRCFVRFDDFLKKPANELPHIFNKFGLVLPDISSQINTIADELLDPKLKHHNITNLRFNSDEVSLIERFNAMLFKLDKNVDLDGDDLTAIDEIRDEYKRWSSVFYNQDIRNALLSFANLNDQIVGLHQAAGDRDAQVSALTQSVAERDIQIASFTQGLSERDNQIAGLVKTIESLIIDRDSWKTGHEHLQVAFRQLSDERDSQVLKLDQVVSERDNQIADLAKTIESLVIDRDSWKAGHEHLQGAFKQLSDERDSQVLKLDQVVSERDSQVLKLNQVVAVREGQISDFKQALAGCDLLIDDLKQTVNDRENKIILLNAENNKITSSHSWKITWPFRFAGRLLRGDWVAVRASIVSLRNTTRIPFVMEEETSANKNVDLNNDAGSPVNDADYSSDRVLSCGKRILLVSYYCPSRAHAGGLRILDIYSLIKSNFPHVQIDLFTHKRPAIDWSYEDVENIFDNIFLSPVEDLSVSGFNQLHKSSSSYDVIDLQFHQAAYDIDSWRKVGKKILYTPMESLLRGLLIAFRHLDIFSVQKMLRNIMLAKEELMFVKKADEVVCVSEKDASSLRMFCHAGQVCALETAVSNIEFSDAVDLKYADITPEQKQPIILYIAYFGSETNINALKWYLVKVHPLISKTLPDYKLQVVGRGDLSVFKDYQSPSIAFVGEVPKLTPYIQNAKVGIAPALNGGGFRGKINQYAIYGVPVVASKIAAKGLAYQDKIDIFITDQDRVFAERCIRLLRDNNLNRAMGQKARDKAFAQYTWESKMDTIKKIYNLEAAET